MKLLISAWAIGCMIVFGGIQIAGAAVMRGRAYEPFDYPDSPSPDNQIIAANNLNGGTGWNVGGDISPNAAVSNWGNVAALPAAGGQNAGRTITSPGLTYSAIGYPDSVGNKATIDASGSGNNVISRYIGRLVDTGTFYFSYLTERNYDTMRTTGLAFFGPANGISGTPGNTPERVHIAQIGTPTVGASGTSGNFGVLMSNLNNATTSAGVVNAANPIAYGTNVTHLVVGRVDFNPAGNETFRLYIDPTDVTSEPATPYIESSAFELTSFNSIRLFAGSAATINGVDNLAASADFDEIRISSSWSDLFSNVPVPPAPFNIFTWKYINPGNPSLGKQQSTTLTPDGYGVHAEPGLQAIGSNLASAYLGGANLTNAAFNSAILTRAAMDQANLTGANLTGANLNGATLTGANLTDAIVKNATLSSTHLTLNQLYSTASYKNQDLSGVQLVGNDLSGANLVGQGLVAASFYAAKLSGANLTNANLTNAELVNADLSGANLTGANFTYGTVALANLSGANLKNANFSGTNMIGANFSGADIRGATLSKIISYGGGSDGRPCGCGIIWWPSPQPTPTYQIIGSGITLSQLVSTASYAAHDLSGTTFMNNNFNGGNFAGFNLTNTNFYGTTLADTDFSGADARGAVNLSVSTAPNLIHPDGHIAGVNLSAGKTLSIRDYDGSPTSGVLPIRVDQQLTMAQDAALRMTFDADAWDSTISFAAGIPVSLSGTLQLALADGVDPLSQVGRTFRIFDWTGVSRNGTFAVDSPYLWDVSSLYTTGNVTFLAAGSAAVASLAPAVPEPAAWWMLCTGLATALTLRRARPNPALIAVLALLAIPASFSFAARPDIQLTQVGTPIWKPADFQLFSAPATPFAQSAAHIFDTILPNDDFNAYTPHSGPYDTELSTGALAGGYVTRSLFAPEAIKLNPNGVYFMYMVVPQPGVIGDSRDFESGPVIPNSLFPLLNNLDVWLDGVLVDKAPGADAVINVQQLDVDNVGISHLEVMQAIWHPWDDDLAIGPLGRYDLRTSMRDASGSGWDAIIPFRVALPGDYDYSGTVGPEDYGVWKKNFGSSTSLDADGNDDHIVDAADYAVWRNNLGTTYSGGSGAALPSASLLPPAVPEPSTCLLAATALCLYRPRRSAPVETRSNRRQGGNAS